MKAWLQGGSSLRKSGGQARISYPPLARSRRVAADKSRKSRASSALLKTWRQEELLLRKSWVQARISYKSRKVRASPRFSSCGDEVFSTEHICPYLMPFNATYHLSLFNIPPPLTLRRLRRRHLRLRRLALCPAWSLQDVRPRPARWPSATRQSPASRPSTQTRASSPSSRKS